MPVVTRLRYGKEIQMVGNRQRRLTVAVAVILALGASSAPAQTRARPNVTASDLSESLESTARLVGPSVVQIFTTAYKPGEGLVSRSADLITTERASGSG